MKTITIIFGSDAVEEYEKTGVIPAEDKEFPDGSQIHQKRFHTQKECEAYLTALDESDGADNWRVVDKNTNVEKCPHCAEWEAYFSRRKSTTYCPNCGEALKEDSENSTHSNTKKLTLQYKYVGQPLWEDFPSYGSGENYNTEFSAAFLHRYYNSDMVAWEDDCQKFLDDEIPEEELPEYDFVNLSKEGAKEEMMRLRSIILDETLSDLFEDLMAGKIKLRYILK